MANGPKDLAFPLRVIQKCYSAFSQAALQPQPNETQTTMTTSKTISMEDWYAPEFRLSITPLRNCPLSLKRIRAVVAPFFRTTHPEPWKPSAFCATRRRGHFGSLREA